MNRYGLVVLACLFGAQAASAQQPDKYKPQEESKADKSPPEDGGTAPEGEKKRDEKSAAHGKEVELEVWKEIASKASSIDNCTARYVSANPDTKGSMTLSLEVGPKGELKSSSLDTALGSQDNLRSCMNDVTRSLRFPDLKGTAVKMTFNIQVAKDVKFKLLRPGEKPPAPKKQEVPADQGYVGWGFSNMGAGN